ncbi:glycosyl transferase possibly involved in lipopolysaccharide synthesis [Burkholderiales bacterium JOSHI_001]|nr:glycosyl transferase possibly involved in lipopolysaccharide synthesis [Burkholderiales bacterium JOSHI_001]
MIKRIFDILCAVVGLLLISPVVVPVMFLVWWEDKHSPFYVAPRVGRGGRPFRMVKLRSMVINADRIGATSTKADDRRITPVGHFIRRYKLDELTQLWNVLRGDMSMVGPRPQVQSGVDLYTPLERDLLKVRPGITDFASIVFADEGDILAGHPDPDAGYNALIRPGKSELGLYYVQHHSLAVDLALVRLTLQTIVSRDKALAEVQRLLQRMGAPAHLVALAGRREPLRPGLPPGAEAPNAT